MILIACSEYQRHYGGGFDFLKNLLWSSLTIIRQNVNMATNALWLDLCSGSLMYSIYVTDVISLLSQGGREGGREEGRKGRREGGSEGVREGGREGGRETKTKLGHCLGSHRQSNNIRSSSSQE